MDKEEVEKKMDELMSEIINEFDLPSPFAFDGKYADMAYTQIRKGNFKKAKSLLVIGVHKEYGNSLLE